MFPSKMCPFLTKFLCTHVRICIEFKARLFFECVRVSLCKFERERVCSRRWFCAAMRFVRFWFWYKVRFQVSSYCFDLGIMPVARVNYYEWMLFWKFWEQYSKVRFCFVIVIVWKLLARCDLYLWFCKLLIDCYKVVCECEFGYYRRKGM